MNYFLQSGLLAINPALVPSALWAAEHRAAAGGVCVVVSDTERAPPERKGPGSSLSPVKAQTPVAHVARELLAAWGRGRLGLESPACQIGVGGSAHLGICLGWSGKLRG